MPKSSIPPDVFGELERMKRTRAEKEAAAGPAARADVITVPGGGDLPAGIGSGWVEPEEDDEDLDKLWLRWPAREILTVRVTSPAPNNYRGHWVPCIGAYRLCTAPRCPWCPVVRSLNKIKGA